MTVKNWEEPASSHAMNIHTKKARHGPTGNILFSKMKRHFVNLKQVHRGKTLSEMQR